MNKLEMAQKLKKWCGMAGTLATTVNQTGEFELVSDWIDDALRDIYNLHDYWKFLRADVSFNTVSGTSSYTPSVAGYTDLARWLTDDVRCYLDSVSDEQEINFIPWDYFKRTFVFGTARTQSGRPGQFSIKPDNSIVMWPVPDDTYTIVSEYYKTGAALTADTDEPLFPSRFHMAVLWRALIYYGADYVEYDRLAFAEQQYSRLSGDLEYDQLKTIGWGAPLA